MPLIKRAIEPSHISRVVVEKGMHNDLECVSNKTLANLIRQLSSLSAHAEELFSELYHETCCSFTRTVQLSERVDRLKVKITELNHTVEEVSLQDINMRKPFKSSVSKDQQIVTVDTRPLAIAVSYQQCDTPPALHKLNVYREDGKDSVKFYTDPGHFFELWCQQMMAKDSDVQTKKQRQRSRKPRQSKPAGTIRAPKSNVDELSAMRHGPELHDALLKTQSAKPGTGSSQRAVVRQSQTSYTSESSGGYALNNGMVGTAIQSAKDPAMLQQQQQPHGAGLMQTQTSVADSGYSSRISYTNSSDYQVPATKLSDLPTTVSSPASPRPMVPPPAPPPMSLESPGYRDPGPGYMDPGMVSSRKQAVRQASDGGGMPAGQMIASRSSLPPPPPAPTSLPDHHQSPDPGYPLQNWAAPVPMHDPRHHVNYELPPPPLTPPYEEELPLNPPSPLPPHSMPPVPSPPFSYPASEELPESPLPLPPEDIDIDVMVVPPPPPPLVESEVVTAKPDVEVVQNAVDKMDRLQPDSASLSSEASSLAAKSLTEDAASEVMVRDKRSDLLDAIRKGIQLRKVEEHRQQHEQKKQKSGKLDVQSIMEAAFERRRRAIEENDSDRDDDDDAAWDDDA